MGIIARQGIKQSIITYLGIAIGAVNVIFIYPKVLEAEQWGFIQVLISVSKVFLPLVLLGSMFMIVRFFPDFKDEKNGHHGYLSFILLWANVGFLFFTGLYYLFHEEVFAWFKADEAMVSEYGIYILPMLYFLAIATTLTKYISNFHRIAIPAIFNDLFVKIGVPILCVLLFFHFIEFENLLQGMVALFAIIGICLTFYTKSLGQLFLKISFKKFTKKRFGAIFNYAGYGILGSIGSSIIPFIDTIMVGAMIGLTSSAIYTIPNFISSAIDAPRRAIGGIVSPLLAESWKANNLAHIDELYKKTSLNQLIAGLFLFLLVWVSIDQIYALMPEGPKKETYEAGKGVVLILGLSKILDMMTGVNSEIIGYSKYFRFNFYAVLILSILSIITNWLLIPYFGIEGAALATLISYTIFNLSKFSFLWWKLNLQPFSMKTIQIILLGIFTYLCIYFTPSTGWIIPNIMIKSLLVCLIFGGGILYFKMSQDISKILEMQWKKYKK